MSAMGSLQPSQQRGAEIAELVGATIGGALAALERESRARLGSPVRRECLHAVEHLWQRRAAVVRALALPPSQRTGAAPAQGTGTPEQAAELGTAQANSTRMLYDAAEGEWRELQRAARQRAGSAVQARRPWPPAPNDCAAGLRWVVERTSREHAVRLELMRLATQLLLPRFVALCRRHLEDDAAAGDQGPPDAPAEPARASPAQEAPAAVPLIDLVQPGAWFRMVLHDQWAAVRLTWRSANGQFFMFSSRLAGRSHAVSRSTLERMIERGQFEPLAHGPKSPRS